MDNQSEHKQPWTYEVDPSYVPYQPPVTPEPEKKKKPLTAGKAIVIALCCALLGGVVGGVVVGLFTGGRNTPPVVSGGSTTIVEGEREDTTIDTNKVDTSKLMTAAEVYATNVNSTVGITTSVSTNLWGYQTTSAAAGSGFIISKDGYIITNHHVIEGSSAITVAFYDGTTAEASLVGYDISNDIAVLKVNATDLTPVIIGDSDNMNVGDDVVAIGNPLGELTFSLTSGSVSALDREVTTSNGVTMNLIQTDCAINSGNSGGALFNLYGEVIGITNAKYSSNGSSQVSIDNIGFAIPVNNVKEIVKSIIQKGYITKAYIGVSVADVSEESQSYGLPKGAAVKQVEAGSPAETAGLKVSDIITKVNDTEITGRNDLVTFIGDCAAGDVLKLTVYRQGTTMEIELTVGEKVQSAMEQEDSSQQQQQQENNDSGSGFGGFGGLFPWPFGGFFG